MHAIPPRSPDLNPIENVFHMVKANLHKDTTDKTIRKETIQEFRIRVRRKLLSFTGDVTYRNNLTSSMPRRVDVVIKQKGFRTKC